MGTKYNELFYQRQQYSSLRAAEEILPYVLKLTGATSVVDVGCGLGTWLSVAAAAGARVRGFDGAYVDQDWLRIDRDDFTPADLSQRVRSDETFDLAMSLEVAEHLPGGRAASFVEDLCALAPVVFFSAAQPAQGGTNHINEQYLDYWIPLFEAQGYEFIDCIRPEFWDADLVFCYQQNGAIFAKPGFLPDEVRGPRMPLRAVHPTMIDLTTRTPHSLRPWLAAASEVVSSFPAAMHYTWRTKKDRVPVIGKYLIPDPEE